MGERMQDDSGLDVLYLTGQLGPERPKVAPKRPDIGPDLLTKHVTLELTEAPTTEEGES